MQTSAFSIAKELPFSVYGENLIILVQNFIILFQIWQLNKSIGTVEKIFMAVFFAAYGWALFNNLLTP